MSCGKTQSQTLHYQSLRKLEIPAPFIGWGRVALMLLRCYERQQQRRALLELDRYRLRDIGVTPEHAEAEPRKPFWR